MDTALRTEPVRSAVPGLDLHRIAGVAGVAAGVLGLAANVLHPRLDDPGDTEALLDTIASYGAWRAVHLAIVASVALGVIALVGVTRSIAALRAAAWARVALPSAIVSGTLMAAAFAVDGFGIANAADEWASAGAARAEVLRQAETLAWAEGALLSVALLGLLGVTQVLYAVALWGSGTYPRWTGAAAAAGGAVGLVSGTWMWLSGGLGAGNTVLFTITAALFTVWVAGASIEMLRGARGAPADATLAA